jgi:hypothetical protein
MRFSIGRGESLFLVARLNFLDAAPHTLCLMDGRFPMIS